MGDHSAVNRLILCVDDSEYRSDGTLGYNNTSNIFRLKQLVRSGICTDENGRQIHQSVSYIHAAGPGANTTEKTKSRTGDQVDSEVKTITRLVCEALTGPNCELFLYGFGHGAFLVRAVAGIMHRIGIPKDGIGVFDSLYKSAMDGKFSQNSFPCLIRFMGLFDALKSPGAGKIYDLSFVNSIHTVRHALALNETNSNLSLEPFEPQQSSVRVDFAILQAWFIGTHQDLGGGKEHDGLSLYPLQWMVIESIKAGLVLEPPETKLQNALLLTFPQFAGTVPQIDGQEQAEWQFSYTNGIKVSMFDIQRVHQTGGVNEKVSHEIRLTESDRFRSSPRKIFDSKGSLNGWSDYQMGTFIHPSVFCLLDRVDQIQENSRFKPFKKELTKFREERFLESDTVPVWMQDSEFNASDVKAFRILVCGKTGVGKSTLINKVFGVEMVSVVLPSKNAFADTKETEESKTYTQGSHDIDIAFESPSHPGLKIHDSRGWQAGSDSELELIAKFLRHRAYQKDPKEALHVIWFCVDSDVSRIEEADKKTFETIAQYSHHVPVFVIGTKKDKLVAFRKMELLEKFMSEKGDFQEANRLANLEADRLAEEQFAKLREQLSEIKHYKADGFCCLSKDDGEGIKDLLSQTISLIADERVRIFCVAAQVVDVEQKINSAISETMRLGTRAIRTAMVPLPLTSVIGTPTISRTLCEHILQCFGFPETTPEAVDEIMSRIVLKHLKKFMTVSLTHFVLVGSITVGASVASAGAASVLGLGGSILQAPPTARMLLKCACDMILILERSFRYGGKYVSTKEIEDAAVYYTATKTMTIEGKDIYVQDRIQSQVEKLIPIMKLKVGFSFGKLRSGFEEIVFSNRFDKTVQHISGTSIPPGVNSGPVELPAGEQRVELPVENSFPRIAELEGDSASLTLSSDPTMMNNNNNNHTSHSSSQYGGSSYRTNELDSVRSSKSLSTAATTVTAAVSELEGSLSQIPSREKSDGRSGKWSMGKISAKMGLRKKSNA